MPVDFSHQRLRQGSLYDTRISRKKIEQRTSVGQVGQQQIRLASRQLLQRVPAGGDGGDAGTDGAGATDVQRRVANDPDVFRGDAQTELFADGGQGLAG